MLAMTPSFGEPRHVGGRDVLRVLDAEAAVARAVRLGDALEDIELHPDRAVADRVDDDLQPGAVGGGGPLLQILLGVDQAGRGRRACR